MTTDKAQTIAIKESSDELNPVVVVADSIPAKPARTFKDYLALAIATCGVGYLPLAPGTFGSLVGIAVYALVRAVMLKLLFGVATSSSNTLDQIYYAVVALESLVLLGIIRLGIWAASRTEQLSARKDPGKVVIDEVAGQYIALLPIPLAAEPALWSVVLAFILFRFFDIVKPYPARRLESLHGGLGIMADDVIAGIYAAVLVAVVVSIGWFF